MNIAQLINRDRKCRLESLVPGQSKDNNNMSFIKNILNNNEEIEDNEQEQHYVSVKQLNQQNIKNSEQMNQYKTNLVSNKSVANGSQNAQNNQSIVLNIRHNSNIPTNNAKPIEISKFSEITEQVLPKPVLAENFTENYYKPNKDRNTTKLEKEMNLQSKINMNRDGRLYGIHGISHSLHNNYYNNNLRLNCGLVAGSKSIPIGPRYTPGWHKMTTNEKILLQQKRKAYESEKEENEEATKCKEIKAENKRRRREQKKIDKEELDKNQKELQKDMSNRYIKYIKDKKRRQRHFIEEQIGKTHDARMCANGWMKTNFEEKPKDKPVDIRHMIDLEFDPSVESSSQKKVKKLVLQKEEGINVGATHLKHEIEEANMLSNSVKDESSMNIECISDVEFIDNNIQQKERIRNEVKERVKKLQKEGKLDGDSESIEEILIESKRDQIKRKDNKRSKITKSIIRGADALSDSYEGGHEDENKENNDNKIQLQEIFKEKEILLINSKTSSDDIEIIDEYLQASSAYVKDLTEYDEDNIIESVNLEQLKIQKDKEIKLKRFEKRRTNFMQNIHKGKKKVSALKIKQMIDRNKLALQFLNQPQQQAQLQKPTVEIQHKQYKTYPANQIIEESIKQRTELMQKFENENCKQQELNKDDKNVKSDEKTDLDFSDKCFLSGDSSDDTSKEKKEINQEKKPTDSDIETSKNIIQEITSILSSDEENKKEQKKSPAKITQQLTTVNGNDLKIEEFIKYIINLFNI